MHRRVWAIGLSLFLLPLITRGQFSSFASLSYGGHTNPLYNYQRIRDNLTQGYLEARYAAPIHAGTLEATYVGGLVLFSDITERNFLEHRLRCSYAARAPLARAEPSESDQGEQPQDDQTDGAEDVEEESVGDESEEEPSDPDSTRSSFDLAFAGSARHDKAVFREFDNSGLTLSSSYRFTVLEQTTLRISPAVTYRAYRVLPELSNLNTIVTLDLRHRLFAGMWVGVSLGGGVKHFPQETYDTTRFEAFRSYVVKNTGKGKAGAKLVVPSEKGILVNATTTTSTQISAGPVVSWSVEGSLIEFEALYRWNPGSAIRYLAQYTNTTTLTEDIYHDQFSYGGPEVSLLIRHGFVFGIQAIVRAEASKRYYLGPAYSLEGVRRSDHRQDLRGYLEIYLSRYIQLTPSLGMDLALSGALLRNESQDAYNDYSLQQCSVSLGFGLF